MQKRAVGCPNAMEVANRIRTGGLLRTHPNRTWLRHRENGTEPAGRPVQRSVKPTPLREWGRQSILTLIAVKWLEVAKESLRTREPSLLSIASACRKSLRSGHGNSSPKGLRRTLGDLAAPS